MLTAEQLEMLMIDEMSGAPRRVFGTEADRILARIRKDYEVIREKGCAIKLTGTVPMPKQVFNGKDRRKAAAYSHAARRDTVMTN